MSQGSSWNGGIFRCRCAILIGAVCLGASPLAAQDTAELLNRMKAMEERIKVLEAEVQSLKGQPPAPASQAAPVAPIADATAGQAAGSLPSYGGASAAAAKVFNPDISLIGNFLGSAGNGAGQPSPALEMRESELGLRAIIDPYARADVFLAFGPEGVEVEEGYLTFTALPGGLQLRAGKMRADFGKVNTLHTHALAWADRPLVTRNLVAGEEGISDAGLSLSRILPAPGGVFLEGTAQVFRGDTPGLFESIRRNDVSAIGHLRAYRDVSESTNLDLGFSYARGQSPLSGGTNQLYNVEATLRWKPLRRSIYRSFLARSEFIWARADAGAEAPAKPLGYYVSADYQLGRRWFLGGRFDRSDRLTEPDLRDTGGSVILTYRPSEFSQLRGQLRRTRYAENATANELLFQLQFVMGSHGAHPF
jgi:hypothetical protein